jgi:hypothetical protein
LTIDWFSRGPTGFMVSAPFQYELSTRPCDSSRGWPGTTHLPIAACGRRGQGWRGSSAISHQPLRADRRAPSRP